MNNSLEKHPKEFLIRLTTGAIIETVGIALALLQWTKMIDVVIYDTGNEVLTLLHVGVFLFIVGMGVQLRAVFGWMKERR
jgi:hypothetical protein